MRVELLFFDGCPGHELLLPRLRQLVAEAGLTQEIELRRITSSEAAGVEGFLGSPTVRVDGLDVEPGADGRTDFGLKCRLYRIDAGVSRIPAEAWIESALARGSGGRPKAPRGSAPSGHPDGTRR